MFVDMEGVHYNVHDEYFGTSGQNEFISIHHIITASEVLVAGSLFKYICSMIIFYYCILLGLTTNIITLCDDPHDELEIIVKPTDRCYTLDIISTNCSFIFYDICRADSVARVLRTQVKNLKPDRKIGLSCYFFSIINIYSHGKRTSIYRYR